MQLSTIQTQNRNMSSQLDWWTKPPTSLGVYMLPTLYQKHCHGIKVEILQSWRHFDLSAAVFFLTFISKYINHTHTACTFPLQRISLTHHSHVHQNINHTIYMSFLSIATLSLSPSFSSPFSRVHKLQTAHNFRYNAPPSPLSCTSKYKPHNIYFLYTATLSLP